MKKVVLLSVIALLVSSVVFADDEPETMSADSLPRGYGELGIAPEPGVPPEFYVPATYIYLPSFPNLRWSPGGCGPTDAAERAGYFDVSGFPRIFRHPDGSDLNFPFGNFPCDNGIFLKPGENPGQYPGRCALASTQAGVFYRPTDKKGHVDDYLKITPEVAADLELYPLWLKNNPTQWMTDPYYSGGVLWQPHDVPNEQYPDNRPDCMAAFMGAGVRYYRVQSDIATNYVYNQNTGVPYLFTPPRYPFYNNYVQNQTAVVDGTWGMARYITDVAGYYSTQRQAGDNTPYNDVTVCYNQAVLGLVSQTNGVTPEMIQAEIEAGWPVGAIFKLLQLKPATNLPPGTPAENVWVESNSGHIMTVYGCKPASGGQRFKFLANDGWKEEEYVRSYYREIDFPTPAEVFRHSENYLNSNYGSDTTTYVRQSNGERYKLVAFSFLRINNNERCKPALLADQLPSMAYHDPVDLTVGNSEIAGCTRIHYNFGGKDPYPGSPSVTLDANGIATSTIPIEQDCYLKLRTYRDATQANDGFLASAVTSRFYSVFSTNKNIKKWKNGSEVTAVNFTVTYVGSDYFYVSEEEYSMFGIRIYKPGHTFQVGDGVQVIVGTISTDSNDERFVSASILLPKTVPRVITAVGVTNKALGGGTWLPPLPESEVGEGNGQLGVKDGMGANNVGSLVRVYGKVKSIDSLEKSFIIDDGSNMPNGYGGTGIKVFSPTTLPAELTVDDFVAATGVCSLRKIAGERYAVVLIRTTANDLTIY